MNAQGWLVPPGKRVLLSKYDPNYIDGFSNKSSAGVRLRNNVLDISTCQEIFYADGQKGLLIIFQGMDTSGKDSMIKQVLTGVNPQGCSIYNFKTPTQEELKHDYLWRYHRCMPEKGKIGIFNRSYYEEALILRVHPPLLALSGFRESGKEGFWKKRFEEFNQFEAYLSNNHIHVVKFYLHISKEEQKKRLLKRIKDPTKHWKFDISDVNEHQHFETYQKAYEEVFSATSTKWAPWYIIPANRKWYASGCVSQILLNLIKGFNLKYPERTAVSKAKLLEAKKMLSREG